MNQVKVNQRGAKRIRQGHLWIYRSDVREVSGANGGDITTVVDEAGNLVGVAFYSDRSEIALRFLATREEVIDREWWRNRLRGCAARRAAIRKDSNAYRLVYSEGDVLPSLIIDVYGDTYVVQTLSQGTEQLLQLLVDLLITEFSPGTIIERNDARV